MKPRRLPNCGHATRFGQLAEGRSEGMGPHHGVSFALSHYFDDAEALAQISSSVHP